MTEPARKKPPADNETSSAAIATRQEQYPRQPHKSPAFSFRKEPLQRERENMAPESIRGHIFSANVSAPTGTEQDSPVNTMSPRHASFASRESLSRQGETGKPADTSQKCGIPSLTPHQRRGSPLSRRPPSLGFMLFRKTITEPGHRSRRDARPLRARQRAYPARQPRKWHRHGW